MVSRAIEGYVLFFPASNRKRSRAVTKFPARLSRWSDIRTSYFGLMCWPLPSSKQNCAVVLPARKFKDIRALRSRFVLCDLHFRTLNRPPLLVRSLRSRCNFCFHHASLVFTEHLNPRFSEQIVTGGRPDGSYCRICCSKFNAASALSSDIGGACHEAVFPSR